MLVRMILACSAILLLTWPGAAADCQTFEHEAREALLRQAPTCDKARKLFGDCAYGAGGDVSLGQIVRERCEKDFLQRLSAGQRRTYDRELKGCSDEYKNQQGSMYRAMAAGCRADVAQSYADKYGKTPSR